MICGGAWNIVLENIDKKSGGSPLLSHKKNKERLKHFVERNDLVDIWRKDTHGDKNHQPYTADLIFFYYNCWT